MQLPDEAVDAATEVVWQHTTNTDPKRIANLVLEAAAPIIAANAWDVCALEADRRWLIGQSSVSILKAANPYKEAPNA